MLSLFKKKKSPLGIEIDRVTKAIEYMGVWYDIPLSWQLKPLCEILNIRPDDSGYSFCCGLLIKDIKESAAILLNCRIKKHSAL